MKEESDRLKLRCFDDIAELAKSKPEESSTLKGQSIQAVKNTPELFKKTINISIANILHGTKTIESEDDIEKLLNDIRERLKNELKENTIIKLV